MIKTFENFKDTKIKSGLIDYFILNDEIVKKNMEVLSYKYKYCYDFYENENGFVINYYDDHGNRDNMFFSSNSEEYKKLKRFIEDPELYKSTNKYNL